MIPGPDIIRSVVAVMRHCCFSDAARAVIRTSAGAAWINAFLVWCLGCNAAVKAEHRALAVEGEPDCTLTMILNKDVTDTSRGFSAVMEDGLGNWTQPTGFLVASNEFLNWSSMLSIEQY